MNRLDQNHKNHLQTLERGLDYYNSHWWLRVLVHFAYFSVFVYSAYHRYDVLKIKNRDVYFWLYCGMFIVSYYFIFSFLIEKLLSKKRYAWFSLLFLLWYFGPFSYVCYKYNEEIELLNVYNFDNWENINLLWMKIYAQYGLWGHFVSLVFAHNVFQEFISSFFFLGFVKSIKYFLDNTVQELKLNRLNYELEAKYLQHQLNPHFLFNSLNNIYGLILQKNIHTVPVIGQLQSLLDHTLRESDSRSIALQTEIEYLKNYINLERIRHGNSLTIEHNLDTVKTTNYAIAPRILLPFVENAFKHGANMSVEKAFISIKITTDNDRIKFEVKNSKPVLSEKPNKIGGIGLKNISRRLALLYPEHHLEITNDESVYKIALSFVA